MSTSAFKLERVPQTSSSSMDQKPALMHVLKTLSARAERCRECSSKSRLLRLPIPRF